MHRSKALEESCLIFLKIFNQKHLATKLSTFPAVTREIVEAKMRKKIQLKRKKKSENAAHIFCAQIRAFFFIFTTDSPPFPCHREKGVKATPSMTVHKKERKREKNDFFSFFILDEKMEKGKGWSGNLNVGGNKNFGV